VQAESKPVDGKFVLEFFMTTFSQLVDKMVLECKRPDMVAEIATYLNQTIRELHAHPQTGGIIFYADNLKEDRVTVVTSDGTYAWQGIKPGVYQGGLRARYDAVWQDNQPVWPREVTPGRHMEQHKHRFYRSGQQIFFTGCGGVGSTISLLWYEYPPSLTYGVTGTRPAILGVDGTWTYAPAYDTDETTRAVARDLVTNWLLLRWSMVLEEGIRAKVYKRVADTERAATSYSMYSAQRMNVFTGEAWHVHESG
jgi:hypothetical protein